MGLFSKLIASEIIDLGAVGARKGFKTGQKISIEIFGYEFLGLFTKLFVLAIVAIAIEKLHFVIVGLPTIASTILGAFGINTPTSEPDFIKKLFSDEGFSGFRYWDLVKFLFIALVAIEMAGYVNKNKKLGGEPDAVTLAVFGIILFAMTIFTVPDLVSKLKNSFNRQAGV